MEIILWSFVILGGLGILFGVGLGIAGKKLAVEKDEKEVKIRALLPGANCGGCGFPGCDGLAAALAKGEASPEACAVTSVDNLHAISALLGVEPASSTKRVAKFLCAGDSASCGLQGNYVGLKDCRAAALAAGGFKNCRFACLGLGSCTTVCQFHGITIGENGLPEINEDLCTGCGKCASVCPHHCLTVLPKDQTPYVSCRNTGFGKEVTAICKSGCIGCKMCEKSCPNSAIEIEDNLPKIDAFLCTACGTCVGKCPKHILKQSLPKEAPHCVE